MPDKQRLLISFQSGIVKSMLADRENSGPFGSFDAEAVERCANMQQPANIIDAATYKIVGRVFRTNIGYAYVPEN